MSSLTTTLIILFIIYKCFSMFGKFIKSITDAAMEQQRLSDSSGGPGLITSGTAGFQSAASSSSSRSDSSRSSKRKKGSDKHWWRDELHTSLPYRSRGNPDDALTIMKNEPPAGDPVMTIKRLMAAKGTGTPVHGFYSQLINLLESSARNVSRSNFVNASNHPANNNTDSEDTTLTRNTDLLKALKSPTSIREAMIISEVFKRPQF
ncbi:MAG: hypothetical protein CVV64_10770 [Candidatus Wallbacteria bacterium HGW-Wallbacteria-1]|jgi:hypothetical protein|uniref:Uncharacterized protein n=1 Tax=Candidatus Wallbacteria bacterium HGW-Wallbacteria-1 TaxID=2013854 RepID=A0A2N1PPJ7_9BACT|nr:MAG: hypothetical protein CVV64_10770 [Candidatus Wallbacteria bacterium HGW-Wallbacteria-1]